MVGPRVPGNRGGSLRLPCGESVDPLALDLGRRSIECGCGATHGVVMDVHPPTRFLPEFLVEVLREVVTPADEFAEFGTPHLMGLVLEEFPDEVAVADVSEEGSVGNALVWVTAFDDRRLHEVIVELVVELMDHAISHADDAAVTEAFEAEMRTFDVEAFVEQYRRDRDLSGADVPGVDPPEE